MRHLLLTRFAINWPAHQPSSAWLSDRYAFLERYTLPSIEAQTCKDFDWLLLADPDFPGIDHKRLESYAHVLWSGAEWGTFDLTGACAFGIRPYLEGVDWLLTTRLDSDDAISNSFVEGLQAAFVERETWYAYPQGYIVNGERAFPRQYLNSPFVSYGERSCGAKTVYWTPHTRAGKDGSDIVVVSEDAPFWAQIDHGGNVKNSVEALRARSRGFREWVPTSTLTQFACFQGGK